MATVTKSIGTSSRDYSTITAWYNDLTNSDVYSSGDDAVGECYDDSAFGSADDLIVFAEALAGMNSVKLIAASGEEHDGTEGTGVRVVCAASFNRWEVGTEFPAFTLDFIELDVNGKSGWGGLFMMYVKSVATDRVIQRFLIHDLVREGTQNDGAIRTLWCNGGAQNCIIYDLNRSTGASGKTVWIAQQSTTRDTQMYNNTVHDVRGTGTSAFGFEFEEDDADEKAKNCIATDTSGSATNTDDFESSSNATLSNNLSSDATASGSGSLTNKASADQYVSNVRGSEDLHLKSGADAIDAGADLGTTPGGVEVDIDGRDRDAQGDTWDMGAHEFVSSVPDHFGLTDFQMPVTLPAQAVSY